MNYIQRKGCRFPKRERKTSGHLNVIALLVLLAMPGLALAEVTDDCGDGSGSSHDIKTLSASFDESSGEITVEMELCGKPNKKTKYRVYFDHTAPFADDADRNGDCQVDSNDYCHPTSDDMMVRSHKKDFGPGVINKAKNTLTYTVDMAALSSNLETGDTILVWADTKNRGIKDRAPDTDDSDGCAKPEVEGEYIELTLDTHRVFVTEASTTGRITVWKGVDFLIGIDAADAICNMEAADAGLQHTDGTNFVAWLSTTDDAAAAPGVPAINRLSEGNFIRTDKAPIAASKADLTDGLIENPIWLKADGRQYVGYVRTATTPEGQIADMAILSACSNWTSGSVGEAAANGVTDLTDGSWTFYLGPSLDCTSNDPHFYCFEK